MKQFLLSFLLTSFSTSILVLFLSFLFAALKTKISVKVKYFIWFLILLSFLFPFRPQFGSGLIRLSTGGTVQTAVRASQTSGGQAVSQVAEKASQANLWEAFLGLPWFEIFFAIWLLGCAFNLGKYAYSYIRFKKMLQRWGTEVEDEETLFQLHLIKEKMGIKSKIRLLHYPMTQSPMLLGFRDILIVLPELDYTEEELQLIFQHELTHYQHYDVLINLFAILAKSLHWFNPVVRFACRETQEAGEMYCDYDVLSRKDTAYRTFYGETILTMIDRSKKTPIAQDGKLVLESKKAEGLSQRQVLETVLKELSLAEKDIKDVQILREKGNYKILFSHGQTAHEMLVNVKTGKVVQSKQHTIVEKTVTVEKEVPASSSFAATPADSGSGNAGQTGSVDSPPPATNTVTNSNTNTSTAPVQPPAQTSSSKSKDKDRDDDKDDDDDDD